jgi:hypothetical protein
MSGATGAEVPAEAEQPAQTVVAAVRVGDVDRDTEDGAVAVLEEFISEAALDVEASSRLSPRGLCRSIVPADTPSVANGSTRLKVAVNSHPGWHLTAEPCCGFVV